MLGVGKSTVAASLALALAKQNKKVRTANVYISFHFFVVRIKYFLFETTLLN